MVRAVSLFSKKKLIILASSQLICRTSLCSALSVSIPSSRTSTAVFVPIRSASTSTQLQADSSSSEATTTTTIDTNINIMSSYTSNNKQSVRVVSYNLLSSHLAEPTFHTKCDPDNLAAENRMPKIIAKLQSEIDKQTQKGNDGNDTPVVFCLQEVSHDWAKELHVFFAERGYHFITALYGRHFNGYMGIGTAYPIQHYKTLQVDICKLSDKRPGGWPRPRKGIDDQSGLLTKFVWNPLVGTARYVGVLSKPTQNPWEKSQYRSNEFIAVQLQKRTADNAGTNADETKTPPPIWIANYHMPCAFREPAVMTLHCELVAQRIQYLASKTKDAFILAGDFNIMPDSVHYKLMTTGKFDRPVDHDENDLTSSFPPLRYGTRWESTISKMKSAYALNDENGKESDFTNYAHNGALSNESFIGTLDYIFLSDDHEWKVKDVLSLKNREDVDGPFPNADEPSDHVMIAATLEV
jgi:2',5'-phosphodiesterase